MQLSDGPFLDLPCSVPASSTPRWRSPRQGRFVRNVLLLPVENGRELGDGFVEEVGVDPQPLASERGVLSVPLLEDVLLGLLGEVVGAEVGLSLLGGQVRKGLREDLDRLQ